MNKLLKDKKTLPVINSAVWQWKCLLCLYWSERMDYPYLRPHRNRALLIMNSLLTNCSSTKSWLCLPHGAVHSNRLVLQEAAAGELPLHSALSALTKSPLCGASKASALTSSTADVLTHCRKARVSTHSICFTGTLKCQWKYFGWLERRQFYFLYCQEYERLT